MVVFVKISIKPLRYADSIPAIDEKGGDFMAAVTLHGRVMLTVEVPDGMTLEQSLEEAQKVAPNGSFEGDDRFLVPGEVKIRWSSEYDFARVFTTDNPAGDGQAFGRKGSGWALDTMPGDEPPIGL
jgi:hypothetical protein